MTTSRYVSCVYIAATAVQFVVVATTTAIPLPQTAVVHRQRRDQSDPCNLLLTDVDTCLLSANPTCGPCVATAFDAFLSSGVNANFTCSDFKEGVCPIVFQQCVCAPCNTELESYFNCVLNDVSDNECPVAYCDPLKDFSATPEACVDDLALATSCIGSDCLQCLGDTIDYGATCENFEEMVCDAVNIDCLSCLQCRNVVEPWLRCLATESKSCDTFQCDSNAVPAASPLQQPVPTMVLAPVASPTVNSPNDTVLLNETTTSPTSVPIEEIVDTPTAAPVVAPMAPTSEEGPTAPSSRDVPATSKAAAATVTAYVTVYTITITLAGLLLVSLFSNCVL